MKKIVIIGGGAAGLMAGIGAGENIGNKEVEIIILEKMPRPGRKIIITGKGKCNLTNLKDWNDFSCHIHPKANFLKHSFYNLSSQGLVDFLNNNGLNTVTERGDRVFPESHSSKDVVDALIACAKSRGVKILTGCDVESISIGENKEFTIKSSGTVKEVLADKVIICTGGLSYPGTGSTGDGFRWASEAGLKITKCFPSLTALVPKNYKNIASEETNMPGHISRDTPLTDAGMLLKGNQLKNVSLKVYNSGQLLQEEFGDLDFTDGGIEGPIGFKVSRKCVNAIINGGKITFSIDLKPAVEIADLEKRIGALREEIAKEPRNKNKSNEQKFRILLTRLLPAQLIEGWIKTNPGLTPKRLAEKLKNWRFDISGFVGYERAVVTAGGISTDELSSKTMECKNIPGMYFAGEILDLDADTGGYNLQTAFSTGYMAGQSAAKSIK